MARVIFLFMETTSFWVIDSLKCQLSNHSRMLTQTSYGLDVSLWWSPRWNYWGILSMTRHVLGGHWTCWSLKPSNAYSLKTDRHVSSRGLASLSIKGGCLHETPDGHLLERDGQETFASRSRRCLWLPSEYWWERRVPKSRFSHQTSQLMVV